LVMRELFLNKMLQKL